MANAHLSRPSDDVDALLARVLKQERRETIAFRTALVILAIGGSWLLWLKDSYAGWQALPSDIVIIGCYVGFVIIKLRDDIRQG